MFSGVKMIKKCVGRGLGELTVLPRSPSWTKGEGRIKGEKEGREKEGRERKGKTRGVRRVGKGRGEAWSPASGVISASALRHA